MANRYCVKENGKWVESTKQQYQIKVKINKKDAKIVDSDKNCDGSNYSSIPSPPTTNNCSDVDKKYTDQRYVMTLDVERYRKAKNKGTYEVDFKFCASDNKNHYYYKPKVNTGTVPPPNQTTPTGYRDCGNGPYKIRCSGTPIVTVQQCLMDNGHFLKHGADGKFGKYTEEALLKATGKKEFTKDEITTLCQKMKPEESLSAPFGKEEQKAYWEDLIKKGSITSKGIIRLINGVTNMYIIKYMKDGTKVQITSEDLTDETKLIQSFDEFDYVVLSPINPADKATAGEVSVLTAGLNQNGEVVIKPVKDGNWKPAKSEDTFELDESDSLVENTIKSILKLRLLEQTVTRTIGSSSNPSKPSSVGGGGTSKSSSTTSSNSSSTPSSSTSNNGSAIDKGSESLNTKTNELLIKLGFDPKDKYLKEKIGSVLTKVNEQNNTLQTIIDQGALSEELIDFNDILKVYYPNDDKNRLKIPTLDSRGVVIGYEEITDKNKSRLLPLTYKDRLTNDYNKRDLSVYGIIGTYYIPKGGVDNIESTPMKTDSLDCLNILTNYLIQALQNKSLGSSIEDEGKKMRDYKDRTITKIQNCYNTGSYDNFVNMRPEQITNVTKNKIPTNLINRSLSFKEIIKLINGEKVAGIVINPMWQSQIVLESIDSGEVIKESIVKKHMIEAIKNKQKDVMVESILRDIKGLKK